MIDVEAVAVLIGGLAVIWLALSALQVAAMYAWDAFRNRRESK